MKIAICDDESVYIDKITECINNVSEKRNVECEIYTCSCGNELLHLCKKESIDGVFLDISMPEISGLKVAKELMNIRKSLILVFVSSKEDVVYFTYEYNPFWFVPKSKLDMLDMVTDRMFKKIIAIENENKYVLLRLENNKQLEFDPKEILYFKTEDHYVQISFKDGTKSDSYRNKLDNVQEQLEGRWFVRVHNRYLLNCRAISTIEKNSCILTNGEQIPISRAYMQTTKKAFQQYMREVR